jgi:hypothetical protein
MRRAIVWLAAAVAVAVAVTQDRAAAQQNLFNVPSGNITEKGHLFFQQQFNFSTAVGSSNTTVDFGLGNKFEFGFNALDINFYDFTGAPEPFARRQVNPDLLINFQKGFDIAENVWEIGIGTQMGFNPTRRSKDVRFQNFTWAVNEFTLPEEVAKIYAGPYYANVAYAGPGDRLGFLLGLEVPIIKDKLTFQVDYISGKRDTSVCVPGFVVTFPNTWQLSLGAQIPAIRSKNPSGVVLELTYPSLALFRKKDA